MFLAILDAARDATFGQKRLYTTPVQFHLISTGQTFDHFLCTAFLLKPSEIRDILKLSSLFVVKAN